MIKEALKDRGIKQMEVAHALGVSEPTISQWLRHGIPAERVVAFEKATGIPRRQLRPDLYEAPGEVALP